MSLKHYFHFILCCCDDVRVFWLDQRENCCLSQCVCNCISCSFRSFKQFFQELFNILHDFLILTAFLFSDDLVFLITCLNIFCSIIDDLTTSSYSLHAFNDLHTLLCSFCFNHFVWSRLKNENLDDLLQCI